MPRTYFKNFTCPHGWPITVEYQMDDENCASIVAMWPNTDEYNRLCAERLELETSGPYDRRVNVVTMDPEVREKLQELDRAIETLDDIARCSDGEMERMEKELSENHIQTSDEVEF